MLPVPTEYDADRASTDGLESFGDVTTLLSLAGNRGTISERQAESWIQIFLQFFAVGFSWNLIFEDFSKIFRENPIFIKIWQE